MFYKTNGLDSTEKVLPFKNSVITKSASSHILCNKMCKQLFCTI